MNEVEFLNFVTTTISAHATLLSYPNDKIKYPNTEISDTHSNDFVEILYTNYMGRKLNLKGNKRMYGCITFKVISERGVGQAPSMDLAKRFAECLSGKILNGIVFEEYELKILDHTLSQTQTTTDIPYNQVNANVEFSYSR